VRGVNTFPATARSSARRRGRRRLERRRTPR
jgi:hypothetical protein